MDEMDYVMHDHDSPTTHPQQQQQQQHQSTCPYWRDHATRASPNRHLTGHQHPQYDPISNMWFSQPAPPSFQWTSAGGPGLPPHSQAHHARPPSESFFSPDVSAVGPGGPGMHNQISQHHDPFAPFPYAYRHSASFQRFGPPPPAPTLPFARDRVFAPHPPTSRTLPPLNPPQSSAPQQQTHMSNSVESNPSGSAGHLTREPLPAISRSVLVDPPRTRPPPAGSRDATPTESNPTAPDPTGYAGDTEAPSLLPAALPFPASSERRAQHQQNVLRAQQHAQQILGGQRALDPNPPFDAQQAQQAQQHAAARALRASPRANTAGSDYDSDDEADLPDIMDDEHLALRFIEQQISASTPSPGRPGEMDEARIRARQLLRGQLSSKRVASKSALSSLQSVEISSLPESERMCVICYNEFGVPNPEGINEAPLRLPRCKHVFGDHCIKKWFEESDSCPYCRDKVPSEPRVRANYEALSEFFRNSYPPRSGGRVEMNPDSASAWALLRENTDAYVSVMLHRAETRYDGSPSRALHAGGRRSPPSDAVEVRRRARARHGSFRAMASSSSAAAAGSAGAGSGGRPNSFAGTAPSAPLHHQSPGRDRFPPGNPRSYNGGSFAGRPMAPPMIDMEPLAPMSSLGFNPPPLLHHPGPHEQAYPGHLNGAPGISPFEPAMPGPPYPRLTDYFHDAPLVHPNDGSGYSTGPNTGGYPASSREFW